MVYDIDSPVVEVWLLKFHFEHLSQSHDYTL